MPFHSARRRLIKTSSEPTPQHPAIGRSWIQHGYSIACKVNTSATQAYDVNNGTSDLTIGFVGNDVDTAAEASHCGSNDGFIPYIYDQIGSLDLEQTSALIWPQIYNGTTQQRLSHNGVDVMERMGGSMNSINSWTWNATAGRCRGVCFVGAKTSATTSTTTDYWRAAGSTQDRVRFQIGTQDRIRFTIDGLIQNVGETGPQQVNPTAPYMQTQNLALASDHFKAYARGALQAERDDNAATSRTGMMQWMQAAIGGSDKWVGVEMFAWSDVVVSQAEIESFYNELTTFWQNKGWGS